MSAAAEPDLHYICRPAGERPVAAAVAFVTATDFLADEPACKVLWDLVGSQFRTRGKFLAVWRCAGYVAVHRDPAGQADGLLLVSAPINWQIDYVVVAPAARGKGVASALVTAALNEAFRRKVPYVMLSSRPELRRLYEGCGFSVVPADLPLPAGPAGR